MIKIDMDKAKEIHKNKLREMRAPKLAKLDVDFMRAAEANNPELQAEIAAKKQALRDVTKDQAIESAQTPEELKAVIPSVLLEE